ncbi:MAG: DnaJ domain-containing protein [Candidatus Omnitrophica bacterium]|jgi:hypothetical protein|nr:DnaJ domain-containing protein [Candidatus Omnitrophota bacterium]
MKPREYIIKYKLDTIHGANNFNHNEFVSDLTIDFMTLLEVGNGMTNYKGFENAVRAVRMKWDGINNKTLGQIPEKLWKYFYATVIIGYKNKLFPEVVKQQAIEKAEKKARYDEYKRHEERERNMFNPFFSIFNSDIFDAILAKIFLSSLIPDTSFAILNLENTATIEEVQNKYRALALIHHPDKGGDNDMFIKITEAKNKCLMYLKRKTI